MTQMTVTALDVSSSAFKHESAIPSRYTCDGQDMSPPLQWSKGPPGTQSYAIIMDDPDAPNGTFVHWVMWNIIGHQLQENIPLQASLTGGGAQGTNSFKDIGYGGPCPPSGTHRYFFHLYALDRTLDLEPGATKQGLLDAMNGHILAQGELIGTYSRHQ